MGSNSEIKRLKSSVLSAITSDNYANMLDGSKKCCILAETINIYFPQFPRPGIPRSESQQDLALQRSLSQTHDSSFSMAASDCSEVENQSVSCLQQVLTLSGRHPRPPTPTNLVSFQRPHTLTPSHWNYGFIGDIDTTFMISHVLSSSFSHMYLSSLDCTEYVHSFVPCPNYFIEWIITLRQMRICGISRRKTTNFGVFLVHITNQLSKKAD